MLQQQQPSFIQNTVVQPKLGLLCVFHEREKQKESEVIPAAALGFSLANPCADYPPTPSFSRCHYNSVGGGCDNKAMMAKTRANETG